MEKQNELAEMWRKAYETKDDNTFNEPDNGDYNAKVIEVKIKQSETTGKEIFYISYELALEDGKRKIFNSFYNIKHEIGLRMLIHDLLTLQVPDAILSNDKMFLDGGAMLTKVLARTRCSLTISEKNGYKKAKLNEVFGRDGSDEDAINKSAKPAKKIGEDDEEDGEENSEENSEEEVTIGSTLKYVYNNRAYQSVVASVNEEEGTITFENGQIIKAEDVFIS